MKLRDIANAIDGYCQGDGDVEIDSLAPIRTARANQLTFVANPRFRLQLSESHAGAVILRKSDIDAWDGSAIICSDPYVGYAQAAQLFNRPPLHTSGIHPTAVVASNADIDESVSIGANCIIENGVHLGSGVIIGPGCVISEDSSIGEDTRLFANTVLYHAVSIGERCIVQSGAVLGSDGFGNVWKEEKWIRVPQLGRLIIGDDVQVGANTTIDRGSLGDTKIGNGVVIDNLVQIAHNCEIGDHTGIAGCVGIAGSVVIGRFCTLAGGVGVADNITIVDDVHITTMTSVTTSIKLPGTFSSGTGLMLSQPWKRSIVRFRQLDNIVRRLKSLERRLDK